MEELSQLTLLSVDHKTELFDCSDQGMNLWLQDKAIVAQVAGTAKTYVFTNQDRVLGYYSLALGRVERKELPRAMKKDMPSHPIPLVLLARLAVDRSLQGRGLGSAMVRDAFLRGVEVSKIAGGVGLFVDLAEAQLEDFYLRLGFLKSPSFGGRLFLPYPRATAALAEREARRD